MMPYLPTQPVAWPIIRPATLNDIDAIIDLHSEAFEAKFGAAFGPDYRTRGALALATTWRRQGAAALHGMFVALDGQRVIGTLSIRTAQHPALPDGTAEQVFHEVLGLWRGLRSLFALSLLDHRIARQEGFISDVAVAADFRRRGVGTALLAHAEQYAVDRRLRFLSLYVAADNLPARTLYAQHHFQLTRRRYSLLTWIFFRRHGWWFMTKDLV